MDEANGTTSSSDQINQTADSIQKEKALDLLNKDSIDENELLVSAYNLINIPILDLNQNIQHPLLKEDNFEIFKDNVNPIFALNLLNLINIINFIWEASKYNIELFHNILLSLNIMFSYLFRNEKDDTEGIDYVLLTPIPDKVFDYISKYGKFCFKNHNNYKFENEYFSPDRNKKQIGLVYQQNSISQIFSFIKDKEQLNPKIMYYLNKETSDKLYKKKIFDFPKNYVNLPYIENKDFQGFNEIDFTFSVKNKVEIEQNFVFNIVKEKNNNKIINDFQLNNNNKIIFEENTNIFIEMKTNL